VRTRLAFMFGLPHARRVRPLSIRCSPWLWQGGEARPIRTRLPRGDRSGSDRQSLEPAAFSGPRAQYPVGVSGCGKRTTVSVACSENGSQCVEGPLAVKRKRHDTPRTEHCRRRFG